MFIYLSTGIEFEFEFDPYRQPSHESIARGHARTQRGMDSGVLSPISWLDEEISVLEAVYGNDVSHEKRPETLIVHSRLAPQIDEQKVGVCRSEV